LSKLIPDSHHLGGIAVGGGRPPGGAGQRALQKEMQRHHGEAAEQNNHQVKNAERHAGDHQGARPGHAVGVAQGGSAPDHLRKDAQTDADPDRRHDQVEKRRAPAPDNAQREQLDRCAEYAGESRRDHENRRVGKRRDREKREADIGPRHHQFALRKIHQLGRPQHEREAERDERVYEP
jgi:hypothetical protein